MQSEIMLAEYPREVSTDELTCAIGNFEAEFLTPYSTITEDSNMTLADVYKLREMPEWYSYMRSVSAGRKRARINEIDFVDIAKVWKRYRIWMRQAVKELPHLNRKDVSGSVSIIYNFDNYQLVTVYHAGGQGMLIKETRPPRQSDTTNNTNTQRKSIATIDFVCGDVLNTSDSNCLLTELRFFAGITREPSVEVYKRVLERLQNMNKEGSM